MAKCTCYTTSNDQYFLYHKFHDFRFLAREDTDFKTPPPLVTVSGGKEESRDTSILQSADFLENWGIQNWGKQKDNVEHATYDRWNSPQNVYISQTNTSDLQQKSLNETALGSTYLTLRTSRNQDFQSVAEVEHRQKNILHASIRFLARVRGAPGAVAGLFTFLDGSNESDVEILTKDPESTVRYTNHPATDPKTGDDIPGASTARTGLPSWTGWRIHRLDWSASESKWFLDDEVVATSRYSVPRKPSGVILNMWSDGGEWSGIMPVGGQAELQVQWVQVLFNTSGKNKRSDMDWLVKRREKGCKVVCAVDGVNRTGWPEVRFEAGGDRIGTGWTTVIPLFLAIWYVFEWSRWRE